MTVKNPETKISLHYFKRKRFSCARLRLLNWVDITDALARTRIKTLKWEKDSVKVYKHLEKPKEML